MLQWTGVLLWTSYDRSKSQVPSCWWMQVTAMTILPTIWHHWQTNAWQWQLRFWSVSLQLFKWWYSFSAQPMVIPKLHMEDASESHSKGHVKEMVEYVSQYQHRPRQGDVLQWTCGNCCNNRATSDIRCLHVCGQHGSGGHCKFAGRIIYVNCTTNTSRQINMVRGPSSCWGVLEPSKCHWSLIDFIWINGEWWYHSNGGMLAAVSIPGKNGNEIIINRLELDEAIKVIGVHQVANSKMGAQWEVLADMITDLGTKIHKNWVPRKLVWQGFNTMIWPPLQYPLLACLLTRTEAGKLTMSLYKLILPKMGLVCSFPKVYWFTPHCFQGLKLPEFYITQEAGKIGCLLLHGDTLSLTGGLLGGLLEQMQLEVGIRTPVLEAPFE